MKEFDLEAALNGQKKVYLKGHPVCQITEIHWFESRKGKFKGMVIINGEPLSFDKNGKLLFASDGELYTVNHKVYERVVEFDFDGNCMVEIPEEICDHLGLKIGDSVTFVINEENEVILKKSS